MRSPTLAIAAAVILGLSAGLTPVSTAAATTPAAPPIKPTTTTTTTTTPIKHFVFMMQGDRSFDNYFGSYPGADGIPAGACQDLVVTKPAAGCVKPYALHGSVPATLGAGTVELDNQYNNGKMNGFVAAYQSEGRDGAATMGYYDARDLSTYWNLASQYVLFDRFFSSTREGEMSNRSYWVSAANTPDGNAKQVQAAYAKQLTIFDRLQAAGVSWKFYVQGYNPAETSRTSSAGHPTTQPVRVPLLNYERFLDNPALSGHIVDMSQYYKDLDAGTLPAVSYIASNGPSERSARSIQTGQALVGDLITNLMVSTSWSSSAFLLSYDGSGGWFDHVTPPQIDKSGYGMRVPALLVSSYARAGFIDSTPLDSTSALKFIEDNWRLAPLAKRDTTSNSLVAAFDFDAAARAPRVGFSQAKQVKAAKTSVTPVYWTYGGALLLALVLLLSAFIAARLRRDAAPEMDPPARDPEPTGATR
jgi:phospholipase C